MKVVIILSCLVGVTLCAPVPSAEYPSLQAGASNSVNALRRRRQLIDFNIGIYNNNGFGYFNNGYDFYGGYGGFGGPFYGGFGSYPGYGGFGGPFYGGYGSYPGYGGLGGYPYFF